MCEKQIYRFDHFTILLASQIRSIHPLRVNGANFQRIFPHLIKPCDKKASSLFLKVWVYPQISS